MSPKPFLLPIAGFFLAVALFLPGAVSAEESKAFTPDKALCAKMLRFGQEAYERGKYLDAKEYFRKAVQADPTSIAAWTHYDQAVIFALAEKVEKDVKLVLPDVSTRKEPSAGAPAPAGPPPAKPAPGKKATGFKIVEDEGC